MKKRLGPKFIDKNKKGEILKKFLYKVINEYKKYNPSNPTLKGNSELYMKAFIMLFLFISPYIVILLFSPSAWIAIPLLFVLAFGMVGSGLNIMHDAAHDSFSTNKMVNRIMSMTIYLQGAILLCWRIQHNLLHHGFTNIVGIDKDIHPPSRLFRFSTHEPWRKNHQYQHGYATFFYGFLTIGKFFGDFASLIEYSKMELPPQYRFNLGWELVKAFVVKTAYCLVAIVLPILVTDYTWWQVITAFFFVHYFSGIFVSYVFQTAHVVEGVQEFPEISDGEDMETHSIIHAILTTSDWESNWFLNWYTGGLNHQVLHHIFYRISHIHYRYIYEEIKKAVEDAGFIYNVKKSFKDAGVSHLRTLKKFGVKPEELIMSSV